MQVIKNLIIGAGPAGLATAGRMRKAGIDFEMIEKSQAIGNSWRNHYDRLHLHTVKKWSHLPHMPFPKDYPTYVSRQQLVDYMDNYANAFSIQPRFGEEAVAIKKSGKLWEVTTASGKNYNASNVIVTTGLNQKPHVPQWPGQELFTGSIIHSTSYKNPKPYLGQKVLVVGIGNTGAEIALDLSEQDISTAIVARGEISLVPRDLNGRPVQVTAKLLEKIPFGDWIGSKIQKIYFGNVSKYGLKISKEYPAVLLRETGKTPLIDIGTIAAIKAGKIKVLGDIKNFTETGVQFENGEKINFDQVILATGFRHKLEDLLERGEELMDDFACPKHAIAEGFHKGLYFVGFDNYKTGGILGTIFNDSETVVKAISEKRKEL